MENLQFVVTHLVLLNVSARIISEVIRTTSVPLKAKKKLNVQVTYLVRQMKNALLLVSRINVFVDEATFGMLIAKFAEVN